MAIDHDTIIEGFVVDPGFMDQSQLFNEMLTNTEGKVASLTPKALSYFNQVSVLKDARDPSTRSVNWFAETAPSLVLDEDVYTTFIDTVNDQTALTAGSLFKIVDFLLFKYDPTMSHQNREDAILEDADMAEIYVPGSFTLSTNLVEGTVHRASGTTEIVDVPSHTKFSIILPFGQTTRTFVVTMFASVDAWLVGYDVSTVVRVVPPLPYSQIYSASLTNSVDNIFSTANITANLSYNTTQATIGTVQVSGFTSYLAVLADTAGNTLSIPFNILFKGRKPTLTEIRIAIKAELLSSGVGDAAGWEARIPGVFVAGRFYIIPYWDLYFTKPDQVLFPSIVDYTKLGTKLNQIMESTAFGDMRDKASILPVYYNKMTCAGVPDLSGVVDINDLTEIIPDYQSYAPEDDNFAYMDPATKSFATQLNVILAIDNGNQNPSDIYVPVTENLLTFYSFVVEKYEMCVITKECYTTIMESGS